MNVKVRRNAWAVIECADPESGRVIDRHYGVPFTGTSGAPGRAKTLSVMGYHRPIEMPDHEWCPAMMA